MILDIKKRHFSSKKWCFLIYFHHFHSIEISWILKNNMKFNHQKTSKNDDFYDYFHLYFSWNSLIFIQIAAASDKAVRQPAAQLLHHSWFKQIIKPWQLASTRPMGLPASWFLWLNSLNHWMNWNRFIQFRSSFKQGLKLW